MYERRLQSLVKSSRIYCSFSSHFDIRSLDAHLIHHIIYYTVVISQKMLVKSKQEVKNQHFIYKCAF